MPSRPLPVVAALAAMLFVLVPTIVPAAPTVTVMVEGTDGGVLDNPWDLAAAPDGTLYVVMIESDNVIERTPGGAINVILDATGDGVHALDRPYKIERGADGSLYVLGAYSQNVFKRPPGGSWTQIIDATGDGMGHGLQYPEALAVDADGNVFVSTLGPDGGVFEITPGGAITRVIDGAGDGAGHLLDSPAALALDSAGNLYVAGSESDNVFRVTPGGVVSEVLASTPSVSFRNPLALLVANDGTLYVGGATSQTVVRMPPGGLAEVIATGWDASDLAFGVDGTVVVAASNDWVVVGVRPNGEPDCVALDLRSEANRANRVATLPDGTIYAQGGQKVYRIAGYCGPPPDVSGSWLFTVPGSVWGPGYTSLQTWTQSNFDVTVNDPATGDTFKGQVDDRGGFALQGAAPLCHPNYPQLCCTAHYLSGQLAADGASWSGGMVFASFTPHLVCSGIVLGGTGTRCANGAMDVGETCDDGNLIPGDGCDAACQIELCDNGMLDDGEQCDDGNIIAGDGCDADCQVEPCWTCAGFPSMCAPGLRSCVASASPGGVSLKIDAVETPKLSWKMGKAGPSTVAELGDPTAGTSYLLCAFDRTQPTPSLVAAIAIPGGVGWKKAGTSGLKLKRAAATAAGGITDVTLKAGAATKMVLKGQGVNLTLPTLPLTLPLTLQLQASDAGCLAMTYSPNGVVKNDGVRVRARADAAP